MTKTLLAKARQINKPVVIDFIGFPPPASRLGNLHFAAGMEHSAQLAVKMSKLDKFPAKAESAKVHGYLRGLFSGGTLASEMLLGLQSFLSPLYSNVPIRDEQRLENPLNSEAHTILDLGEDVFTVGRLHPMMDNDLRLRRLKQEGEDEEVGLILMDVVLGEGSHADPASELAPAIAEQKKARKDLEIVVLIIGSNEDPQDIEAQSQAFSEAGAKVFFQISKAINYIASSMATGKVEKGVEVKRFSEPLAAINVGVETFYESLKAQEAEVVQVDWRPPAGGNEDLMSILDKMRN